MVSLLFCIFQPGAKCKWIQKSPGRQKNASPVSASKCSDLTSEKTEHKITENIKSSKTDNEENKEASGVKEEEITDKSELEETEKEKLQTNTRESVPEIKSVENDVQDNENIMGNSISVHLSDQLVKEVGAESEEKSDMCNSKDRQSVDEIIEDIADFELDIKRRPSPLYHNDSGVGTSLNSPVGSSNEASPQHVCQDVPQDKNNSDKLYAETLTLCSEIGTAFSESDSVLSDGTENSNNNAKNDKSNTSNNNGAIEKDKIIEAIIGAKNEHIVNQDNGAITKIIKTERSHNIIESQDNMAAIKDTANNVIKSENEKCAQELETKNNEYDSKVMSEDKDLENDREQSCEIEGKLRLSLDEDNKGSRNRLSSSNLSAGSAVSAADSYPEVFSPDASSSMTSFQQYYINKRNLGSSSANVLESQVKKSQMPKKLFNPFPVKHVNQNRAKTGIKLGLYKQSTLEEFERNLKGNTVWGK